MTLTVLALVSQDVAGATAHGLVAAVDSTVASVLAVVLTGAQVAVGPSEARETSTGGGT